MSQHYHNPVARLVFVLIAAIAILPAIAKGVGALELNRYECTICGYVTEPLETPPDACAECGSPGSYMVPIGPGAPAGVPAVQLAQTFEPVAFSTNSIATLSRAGDNQPQQALGQEISSAGKMDSR